MIKLMMTILCFGVALTACSAHKIDIQQGNVVTKALRDQLEIGMTRAQVQQLLGSALLVDPFRNNRWDYLYYFKPGEGEAERRHIMVFFENDKVSRIASEFSTPGKQGERTDPTPVTPAPSPAHPDSEPPQAL